MEMVLTTTTTMTTRIFDDSIFIHQLSIRYRHVYYHRQTKHRWSRDDPALMILLVFILSGKLSKREKEMRVSLT
jgi:hypothetical protein